MTKPHTCYPSSASSKLGIVRDSHAISKMKPKIRIIHMYAPQVIKTDAANFRELVQRLTGMPEDEGRDRSKSKTALAKDQKGSHPKKAMIMQDEEEFVSLQNGKRVKNEHKKEEVQDDIWKSKENEKFSGYLDGFSELDGFMEQLSTMPEETQKN
ncbi:hypothetical protein VNO78_13127 [Psophocarpus tetragonolobus]|uniref:VQ domain-containing protein n=1 Tax=Psophocarpus tetragonolobus TaxID=3891 RepID=A0AAN9SRY6_PSOTE